MSGKRSGASDEEFARLFTSCTAEEAGRQMGITPRRVFDRRIRWEKKYGRPLVPPSMQRTLNEYPHRAKLNIQNGCVIIGSDFHIWPGKESTALRAFKKFCKDLKPSAVILNGDVLDFPQISRHPPIGWENTPSPKEEIEAAQDHLNDIAMACGKAQKYWPLGNHDARLETRLATVAPEYRGLHGVHLSDSFPLWRPVWAVAINDDVMVKHRFPKGGKTHNRTLHAGVSTVQGHNHCQRVTPFSDYLGTRYEVDLGCVQDVDHKAFRDYTEDGFKDWRSGFGVFYFSNGRLLAPQLVTKWDDRHVEFRGSLHRV